MLLRVFFARVERKKPKGEISAGARGCWYQPVSKRRKSQRAFSIIKCTKAAVQRRVNDLNLQDCWPWFEAAKWVNEWNYTGSIPTGRVELPFHLFVPYYFYSFIPVSSTRLPFIPHGRASFSLHSHFRNSTDSSTVTRENNPTCSVCFLSAGCIYFVPYPFLAITLSDVWLVFII